MIQSPILRVEKLAKHFGGVIAINELSLGIRAGEITGMIGPNGSGKTTLINLLTGQFPIDGGMIWIGERSLKKIQRHRVPQLDMTRTFQSVRLIGQISVWDNLMVVFAPHHPLVALFARDKKKNVQRAEKLLKKVSLWEKRNELAENLSYGQRKLLEVVRALAMYSKIIFFDEPFAGLFPEMIELVKKILFELKNDGCAVVLVEHNMEIIRSICDHILFLDEGKLMAEGTSEEVFSRTEVLEAYLGE